MAAGRFSRSDSGAKRYGGGLVLLRGAGRIVLGTSRPRSYGIGLLEQM
jgi:hypothetical protein